MQANFLINKGFFFSAIIIVSLTGCSQYKSSWSCKNPEGIGCSSITYADQVARKHIILNGDRHKAKGIAVMKNKSPNKAIYPKRESNRVLIKGHYSDFKKYETKEVEID